MFHRLDPPHVDHEHQPPVGGAEGRGMHVLVTGHAGFVHALLHSPEHGRRFGFAIDGQRRRSRQRRGRVLVQARHQVVGLPMQDRFGQDVFVVFRHARDGEGEGQAQHQPEQAESDGDALAQGDARLHADSPKR